MKVRAFITTVMALIVSFTLSGQSINEDWKKELTNSLHQFMQCEAPIDDQSPCNIFVGESLKVVYEINDFYSSSKQRYLLANEIYDFLEGSDKWTLLGNGSEQSALNNAQGYANLKKAVVAVYKAKVGHGHIALVLPGNLVDSGKWAVKVPNSASFFLNKPAKSYINQKLSMAFSKDIKGEVKLYGRNY